MEINIKDDSKIVEIWLTNSEKCDLELRASLKPVYSDYTTKKYTVAVLESGSGEVYDGMRGLLAQN